MNLLSLVEQFGKVEAAPLPRVDVKRCLHQLDRSGSCRACAALCPVGAITFGEGPEQLPRLDPEACQRCLACLPACPTGAFAGEDAVPDLLRCASRLRAEVVEVLCIHHPEPEQGPGEAAIRVRGCLAGLGSAAYLALAAQGVPAVMVRTDACDQCPWAALAGRVEGQVAAAEALLNLWPAPMALTVAGAKSDEWHERPHYRAETPPFSRRALAQMAREAEGEAITPGTRPFHQRLRSLHSLQALPALTERALAQKLPPESSFALVYVEDSCNACGTCARACPTSALELEVRADRFQLTLAPQACVACDACARLCPQEAIVVEHEPVAAGILGEDSLFLLYEGEARRCLRCNAPFAPRTAEATHCDICDYRRQHRFGAKVPPGLAGRALSGRQLKREKR